MAIILNNKLIFTPGKETIVAPYTKEMDNVKVYLINEGNKIFNHSIYPNGLVIQTHQYVDKIVAYSNWNFVKQDNGHYIMVKPK